MIAFSFPVSASCFSKSKFSIGSFGLPRSTDTYAPPVAARGDNGPAVKCCGRVSTIGHSSGCGVKLVVWFPKTLGHHAAVEASLVDYCQLSPKRSSFQNAITSSFLAFASRIIASSCGRESLSLKHPRPQTHLKPAHRVLWCNHAARIAASQDSGL